MNFDSTHFRISDTKSLDIRLLIGGAVLLLLSLAGWFQNSQQFFYSYLVAWVFWTSVSIGALFFVLLFHITSTVWGVVLRRIIEALMMTFPLMLILFIPIALGIHDLYHWSHADAVAHDPLLQAKSGYLNSTFFLIRSFGYLIIWSLLARALYKRSLAMDEKPGPEHIIALRRLSAIGLLLFAITVSFASFDWLMSLDPHWYSTIYGLYFFSGALLALLSTTLLFSRYLLKNNILTGVISTEHFHDLAKFIFGFVIFWAYMGFSQYFLIWYANIPEETVFYLHRWEGAWKYFGLMLIFGHFAFPFVGLLTRSSKRNLTYLAFMAYWVLAMRWLDLYWLALPNLHKHDVHLSVYDLSLFAGIGLIFFFYFRRTFFAHPVIPVKDPNLQASIKHEIA